jgi:hypothetical protein
VTLDEEKRCDGDYKRLTRGKEKKRKWEQQSVMNVVDNNATNKNKKWLQFFVAKNE